MKRRRERGLVLVLGLVLGGCSDECLERYLFVPAGVTIIRCDKVTGACVAGMAGERAAYAILPPGGVSLEAWAAEEGLQVGAGEGDAARPGRMFR